MYLRSNSGETCSCPTSGQDTANCWPLFAASRVAHTHTQALRYGAGGGQVDMFRQGWGEGLFCSDLLTDLTYPCLSSGLPD